MTSQKIKIGTHVEVNCEVWNTGGKWGHRAVCLYNGYQVAEAKIRYYNRTWEAYQFDSVKKGLLAKLDNQKVVPLKDRILIAKTFNK